MEEHPKVVCNQCYYEADAHSFCLISETEYEKYYYYCPVDEKYYYDADSIETHILLEIDINCTKPWILIFDSSGYGLKHLWHHRVRKTVYNLLSSYLFENLKNIIIINPSMIFKSILNTNWYFIPIEFRNKIKHDDLNKNFAKMIQTIISKVQ